MKLKLDPKILNMPLEDKIKDALKDAKNIEDKIYLSIAYFQYINKLSTNKAIRLFKELLLSDGQKLGYPFSIYYAQDNKLLIRKIEIPLKIDEFLANYINEIKNYKSLISKVTKSTYNKYLRKYLNIKSSDILAYIIYKMIEEIGIHTLISLRKHWALFSRNLLPYLLKNKT
jgi:hypothetical protein